MMRHPVKCGGNRIGLKSLDDVSSTPPKKSAMDAEGPLEQFFKIPPVTRTWFLLVAAVTITSKFGFISLERLWFYIPSIMRGQVWRLVTCFSYIGKLSFAWLMNMMMLCVGGLPFCACDALPPSFFPQQSPLTSLHRSFSFFLPLFVFPFFSPFPSFHPFHPQPLTHPPGGSVYSTAGGMR